MASLTISLAQVAVFAIFCLNAVKMNTTEPPPYAVLDVKPNWIDVNLTETFEMECRLQGRNFGISHIVSIVMLREEVNNNNVLVASVTSFDPAKPATDYDSLQAFGSVNLPNNQLRLVWDHPSKRQASMYTCEINAIDSFARPLTLMSTFNVTSRVPSIEVMIHHIRDLEKRADTMEQKMEALEAMIGMTPTAAGPTRPDTTST